MSEDEDIRLDEVRELKKKSGTTGHSWPDDPENTASALKEFRYLSEPLSPVEAKKQMSSRSRRGFLVGGAAALLSIVGWRWMPDDIKSKLFRSAFEFNQWVSRSLYSPKRLAPEFPAERITPGRVNGMLGLETEIDMDVIYISEPWHSEPREVSIAEIKLLPRTEMITELKCIEGWSVIVRWAGVRFSDLIQHLSPGTTVRDLPEYVSLKTPDGKYFVGWDIESMMHPQTILAYEMNGEPLTVEHGAPLRLASPLKYGIKQIKRIGAIDLTDTRPKDYWAESGYDWYSGH